MQQFEKYLFNIIISILVMCVQSKHHHSMLTETTPDIVDAAGNVIEENSNFIDITNRNTLKKNPAAPQMRFKNTKNNNDTERTLTEQIEEQEKANKMMKKSLKSLKGNEASSDAPHSITASSDRFEEKVSNGNTLDISQRAQLRSEKMMEEINMEAEKKAKVEPKREVESSKIENGKSESKMMMSSMDDPNLENQVKLDKVENGDFNKNKSKPEDRSNNDESKNQDSEIHARFNKLKEYIRQEAKYENPENVLQEQREEREFEKAFRFKIGKRKKKQKHKSASLEILKKLSKEMMETEGKKQKQLEENFQKAYSSKLNTNRHKHKG